jgi:hypothetical protein
VSAGTSLLQAFEQLSLFPVGCRETGVIEVSGCRWLGVVTRRRLDLVAKGNRRMNRLRGHTPIEFPLRLRELFIRHQARMLPAHVITPRAVPPALSQALLGPYLVNIARQPLRQLGQRVR